MINDQSTTGSETLRYGWVISFAFWLSLFFAAALYGVVALAPKYLTYVEEQNDYAANQMVLVKLESRVIDLERVAHAMQHDPQFSAELARREFNAAEPGDERIPVGRELQLEAVANTEVEKPAVSPPIHRPLLLMAAGNETLRRSLLASAVVILLLSFTFLHESQAPHLRRAAGALGNAAERVRRGAGFLNHRYRKRATAEHDDPGSAS